MILFDPKSREEWLNCRKSGIGGSDAGSVAGLNKYKSNVKLWNEKTGKTIPEDISDKPAIKFGKQAEPVIRELFKLNFPQYTVDYHEYRMYGIRDRPFMYATLDGELTECETGLRGVLEIKTTTIQNSMQWSEWDNRIPDSYYVQILHQLACTGWSFAILYACINYTSKGEKRTALRYYRIDRNDVSDDIEWLIQKETDFWRKVVKNEEPDLILPEI